MQEIDKRIDFLINNGDKKWLLYELITSINQGLFEFAEFITIHKSIDNSSELDVHNSKVSASYNHTPNPNTKKLRFQILQPSQETRNLKTTYEATLNQDIGNNMVQAIDLRKQYDLLHSEVLSKSNQQLQTQNWLEHVCSNYGSISETETRFGKLPAHKHLQSSLVAMKSAQKQYLSSCLQAEKHLSTLTEGITLALRSLNPGINFSTNEIRILGRSMMQTRKGLSLFLDSILLTREKLRSHNLALNKKSKFNKIISIYNSLDKTESNLEFDPTWPTFLSSIEELKFENGNGINPCISSFRALFTAFKEFMTQNKHLNQDFSNMMERVRGVDRRMTSSLQRFSTSGDHSDHKTLNALISNQMGAQKFLRKLTVKCFGDGSNAATLRTLIGDSSKMQKISFSGIEALEGYLNKATRDEMHTPEFWEGMSYKMYDFINRIFLQESKVHLDFVKQYDYSLAYTTKQLIKIDQLLENSLTHLEQSQVAENNLNFADLVFEEEGNLKGSMASMRLDDRPVYGIDDLGGSKSRVWFKDGHQSYDLEIPELKSISPPSLAPGSSKYLKIPPKIKDKVVKDDPKLMTKIDDFCQFFRRGQDSKDYKYKLMFEKVIPKLTVEDYVNLVCVDRPITVYNKLYSNFRDYNVECDGDVDLGQTFNGSYGDFSKNGKGFLTYSSSQEHPMSIKIPLLPDSTKVEQETLEVLLSPSHFVTLIKSRTPDIPGAKNFVVVVVLEATETTSGGCSVKFFYSPFWNGTSYIQSIVTQASESEVKQSSSVFAQNLVEVVSQNKPVLDDTEGQGILGTTRPYADEIMLERVAREEKYANHQEKVKGREELKGRPEVYINKKIREEDLRQRNIQMKMQEEGDQLLAGPSGRRSRGNIKGNRGFGPLGKVGSGSKGLNGNFNGKKILLF